MTAPAIAAAYEQGLGSEASLVAEIAELREREVAAVAKAVADDPGKSAYRPNSPAELLRRKREAAERRLADLREFEMPARQRLAQEAQTRQAAAELERAKTKARRLDAAEEKALDRAASAFAEFAEAWNDLYDAAREREQIAADLQAGGFTLGDEVGDQIVFRRTFGSIVDPFPADAEVMFNACVMVAVDDHAESTVFAQANPDAARFAVRLREARQAGLVRRAALNLSTLRFGLKAAEFSPGVRGEARAFRQTTEETA